MKYPFIIFYRKEQYNNIDNFFIEKSNDLECSIFIADSIEHVKNLHNSNFQILITYGENVEEYKDELLSIISIKMLIRHIHILVQNNIFTSIVEFNKLINKIYITLTSVERIRTRPTFSLFTPSYNSYDKIFRVYNSLIKQSLKDWEWIIIDDSPDDKHFNFLRQHFNCDSRIRFYRRSNNNGSIGNVKNETIGLCRGEYVLEMDHDDEIMPYVLTEAADVFNKNLDIGFIYFDCACVYENGTNQWYGDFICKGYGGYYSQKYQDKWLLVYMTPNINNITLSHLVCCPNHPRIWRRDLLLNLGSYSEYLPICDDYEILLRTAINTKIAKIHKLGYIQYMNDSNNNFSLIRNSEINRIGPNYIYPLYFEKFDIHNKMKKLDAFEDTKYIENHSKLWERDPNTYNYKYCNLIINNDYDKQYCLLGLDSLLFNYEKIKQLYKNERNDFIILENKSSLEYLQNKLDSYELTRIKCYSLIDTPNNNLINYFNLLYCSNPNYEIINNVPIKPFYNSNFNSRYQVINYLTKPDDKYLEIGVEYGDCFNNVHFKDKVGIDPDPKTSRDDNNIIKLTSDEYFKQNNSNEFDVIFIDGMHQSEYFLRDINNSINMLANNGIILVDDILPLNYNEQLKIPNKHYYENGILKYGESWTGDIWKVLYHMLLNFNDELKDFAYFYNINFRGIASFKIHQKIKINEEDIEVINNYNYFSDFNNYVKLLVAKSKS